MANQNLLVQISIPTVDMTLEMAEPRYAQKKAAEEEKVFKSPLCNKCDCISEIPYLCMTQFLTVT